MSKQTTVPTFWANIYCGLRVGYGEGIADHGDVVRTAEQIESVCREFVDVIGLCVMVTPTTFVYTNGEEPGVIVGLINYPRFPSPPRLIRRRALELAKQLREDFGQIRVSVAMPDETVMLGEAE